MDAETLKDVLINLRNEKYSKKEILEGMAWGERNTDIFFPLLKEFRPEYYWEGAELIGETPFKSVTFLSDFGYIKL